MPVNLNGNSITSGTTFVSGSSQITLSATTGYGSLLNQAVLTSSSPTFAGGTFTSNVIITGSILSTTYVGVNKAGADGVGEGPYVVISQTANSKQWLQQLNATAGLDYWHYNGTAWSIPLKLASTGASTFSSTGLFQGSSLTIGSAVAATNVDLNINSVANKAGRIQFQQSGVNAWSLGNGAASEDNNFELYNSNGTMAMKVIKATNAITFIGNTTITGNLTISGTLTENSSIRYKENIEPIKYGLDKVLQMRGVTYNKKDTGVKEIGLIAEELNEIAPELVNKNEEGLPDSVSYGRVVAYLIEAIKDLQKEIEELKSNK